MRLTNDIRDRIVRSVMADVPLRDWQAEADAIVLPAAIERLPDAVRRLWKNSETRPFIQTAMVYAKDRSTLSTRVVIPSATASIASYEREACLGEEATKALDALGEEKVADKARLKSLQNELRANLAACSTVKQVGERFPDLASYLPSEAATPNLPATTAVIDKLRDAGWPVERQAA